MTKTITYGSYSIKTLVANHWNLVVPNLRNRYNYSFEIATKETPKEILSLQCIKNLISVIFDQFF